MFEVTIIFDSESDAGTEFSRYDSKVDAIKYAHSAAFAGDEVHVFDYEANEYIFDAYA